MKNRLSNISNDQLQRCVSFARANPGIISVHHLLQKLAIFDFVAPIVRRQGPCDLLEVGCGLGIHSALLSHSARVCATELVVPGSFVGAGAAVDDRRERVFRELGRESIHFAYNDGRTLPYADSSFDVVFHNSVIEHVPDVLAFNREIGRILRPGGVCICITGAPPLCWLRFVLGSILKFPVNLTLAVAREVVPASWLTALAGRILASVGAGKGLIRKAEARLASVSDRVGMVFGPAEAQGADAHDPPKLRSMYPRLQHYLDAPAYNHMVFEGIARELGLTVDQLGPIVRHHFVRSLFNRIAFSLTPRTHGQHYRNWVDERREWKVDRWIDRFVGTGFVVEDVQPYRFHYVFEAMPLRKWDAYAVVNECEK